MAKQKADRKRRQVEMKKREKEANEKRLRLLNDLDKRQKEARKKAIAEGKAISCCSCHTSWFGFVELFSRMWVNLAAMMFSKFPQCLLSSLITATPIQHRRLKNK